MKILVDCTGCFIGDIFFSSSLAKCLKKQYVGCEVYYYIPLIQPLLLLQQNPHIDGVSIKRPPTLRDFDLIINIPEINQSFPATLWLQSQAGIPEEFQELAFEIFTLEEFDWEAEEAVEHFKSTSGQKVITYQNDWAWRAYACTSLSLEHGIGAPHRDIDNIIAELKENYFLLPVGFSRNTNNFSPEAADPIGYAKTASLIKAAGYFIGAEGGLQNLSAGCGAKTIYTTDFIFQNYGATGRLKKIENPQMGSCVYFPNAGHVALDPCIADKDIAQTIREVINGN